MEKNNRDNNNYLMELGMKASDEIQDKKEVQENECRRFSAYIGGGRIHVFSQKLMELLDQAIEEEDERFRAEEAGE